MGRPRINEDHTPARLPAGTLDRIEAVLREREKRADFIRSAIERELKRREGMIPNAKTAKAMRELAAGGGKVHRGTSKQIVDAIAGRRKKI